MFKENYENLFEQITPSPELINKTVNTANAYNKKSKKVIYRIRKPLIAFVILCLCISIAAVPVVAASVDSLYYIFYYVSPSAAQFFKPVQMNCESNGIEMNIISSYIHDDTAEIYISLRDLEGDRIDETTDLFDSYYINTPFDCSSHCEMTDFNEETKTATFLITITQWNNETIEGSKITFLLRSIISNKKKYNGIAIPIDLSKISEAEKTQTVYDTYFDNGYDENSGYVTALVPGKPYSEFEVDGIDLTAIGYIDGKLHIQTAIKNKFRNDNHGRVYFVSESGMKIKSDDYYQFSNMELDSNNPIPVSDYPEWRVDYVEYIFDIPKDELSNYSMKGYFITSDNAIEGRWSITFPIENNKEYLTNESKDASTETDNTTENIIGNDLVKVLEPKTKDDYYHKILNSIDYYNTVSGNLETNMLNGYDETIEYNVDMTENSAYQRTKGKDFDEEVYVQDNQLFTVDNINKTKEIGKAFSKDDETENYEDDDLRISDSSGIPVYKYRQNPTNLHYASTVSIFPQEIAFGYLAEKELWEVVASTKYLGRECAVIKGEIVNNKYIVNSNITSFNMTVDNESGIILKFEGYDYDETLTEYMTTNNISFEKTDIKAFDDSVYADYEGILGFNEKLKAFKDINSQ